MAAGKKNKVFGKLLKPKSHQKELPVPDLNCSLLEKRPVVFTLVLSLTVQWQRSSYFYMQLIGYCKKPALRKNQRHPGAQTLGNSFWSGMRDIETVSPCKQGRVWAVPQPTRSGTLSQVADL